MHATKISNAAIFSIVCAGGEWEKGFQAAMLDFDQQILVWNGRKYEESVGHSFGRLHWL